MHAILFIIYFILLCIGISRLRFFRNSEVRTSFLLVFFGLRVLTACIHSWIAWRYYPDHGEIWHFFAQGLDMKRQFLQAPLPYLKDVLPPLNEFSFFNTGSPWYYLEFRFVSGVNTVFDFLSFDDFYINSLLFSFFVFCGSIALFRVFKEIFHNNGLICALLTLLVPSTLFWTACIDKEGMIYCTFGFFTFFMHRLLTEKLRFRDLLACLFFLFIGIFCRSYLLFGLMPAILFWIAGEKVPLGLPILLTGCFLLLLGFVYMAGLLYPTVDPLTVISERQQDFLELSGPSKVYLPALQPNLVSFINVLPTAFINGFLQPLPGRGGSPVYWLFSVETLACWAIIFFAITRRLFAKRSKARWGVFDISCLLLAVPCILLVGYTIPFIGGIIRYRSIYLPFLLVPFIHTLSGLPALGRANKSLSKMIAG